MGYDHDWSFANRCQRCGTLNGAHPKECPVLLRQRIEVLEAFVRAVDEYDAGERGQRPYTVTGRRERQLQWMRARERVGEVPGE